ncbi:MAG: hypothetical protein ACI9A7_000767 [Cyclobacteriaceae bacterium]|jgi:uncharacterized protein YjdB
MLKRPRALLLFLILSNITNAQELIFHFPFDKDLNDSTSNQFRLSARNNDYTFQQGMYGESLYLDGSENAFDLDQEGILDPSQEAYTICAWVNSQAVAGVDAGEQIIVAQKNGAQDKTGRIQMYLSMNNDKEALASFVGNTESNGNTIDFPTNAWKHIAIITDPETNTHQFFIDGIADGSTSVEDFEPCTGAFRIGAHKNSARYFKGQIDELYYFKGKLTLEQITQVKDNQWIERSSTLGLELLIAEIENFLSTASIGEEEGAYSQEVIDVLKDGLDLAKTQITNGSGSYQDIIQTNSDLNKIYRNTRDNVNKATVSITINTSSGHDLTEGFAGYNMRIGDSPWTYMSPVFKAGAKEANPGFLRYFSGTRNNYLDMNTGQYEFQHFEQVASDLKGGLESAGSKDGWSDEAPNDLKWVNGKIPHRIFDMYEMCGELGAKLVVTLNSFVQTPDEVKTFVKFIKDNNIIVEAYQFTNEPNFYTPDRRFFFNDGKDFAYKMKEIAEAVRNIDPYAKIAHNYGWDGLGRWAKGIKDYESEQDRYWDYVSFHSYAIHGGESPDLDTEIRRANGELQNRTNNDFFNSKVTPISWKNSKIIVTEYGVWNSTIVNGSTYAGIYTSEYVTRMSAQARAHLIGNHHIGEGIISANNYKNQIFSAFNNQYEFDSSLEPNSYTIRPDKHASNIAYGVINNSHHVWESTLTGGVMVSSNNGDTPGVFVTAYDGMDSVDYLLVINKSEVKHKVKITLDHTRLTKSVMLDYAWGASPLSTPQRYQIKVGSDNIEVEPYSVTMIAWKKESLPKPKAPRLYQIQHESGGATLKWWKRDIADEYVIKYGTSPDALTQEMSVINQENATITGLSSSSTYYFGVIAKNQTGASELSNIVATQAAPPATPEMVRTLGDDRRVTLHWNSVPYANGYIVRYGTSATDLSEEKDAKNASGVVIRGLMHDQGYFFQLVAYNGNGESEPGPITQVNTSANIPWAPYLLQGEELNDGRVELSWVASDFNRNATFSIYHCGQPWDESTYELVASGVTATKFTDGISRSAGTHYYRVLAEKSTASSFFYSNISTVEKNINRVAVTNITISAVQDMDSVAIGSAIQLQALITPSNATNGNLEWSSADESIATISSSGRVSGLTAGTVIITATAKDGSGISDTFEVKVYNPVILVSSIMLSGDNQMKVDEAQIILAEISPEDATDESITWSSTQDQIATVDETGLVTSLSGGNVTITASANDNSGIQESFDIEIIVPLGFSDKNLTVYPNPVGDGTVSINVPKSLNLVYYEFIDTAGQVLKYGTLKSGKSSVDIHELNSGLYFVQFRTETEHHIQKVLVN